MHRARVPVVKVSNEVHASGIAFDVVVNNNIALRNSALLRSYAAYDERARQLMLLVKSWAKERRLNEAPNGTLSSYAHVNLVIFFLTKTRGEIEEMMRGTPAMTGSSKTNDDGEKDEEAPLLPNLQILQLEKDAASSDDGAASMIGGLDTRFCGDLREAREATKRRYLKSDSRSVPELFRAYFEWFAWLLEHALDCTVSLKSGRLLSPKRLLWHSCRHWRVSIEDPFETHDSVKPHDLGIVLTPDGQNKILSACQEMKELLKDGGGNSKKKNIDGWLRVPRI